ncbi:Aldo/keto reductase [Auriculariales sp. MPI-PUGE-AT-0066]|nr:Aldo/keto reductase [Auriculariales sp. MPI-PUGE-AT-0066]
MAALTLRSTVKLSSGFQLPVLGLGVYKSVGDEVVTACLAALKNGYRHIDTATAYKNEQEVSEAIRRSDVSRSDIFITSKINSPYQGFAETLTAVETSLGKLGTDYIDLYLVHDPVSGRQMRLDTYRALIKKRDEGKLRSIGVSNFNVRHLEEIIEAGLELPTVNQLEVHPFCQQREIILWCTARGIVIEAYCPVMRMAAGMIDHPVLVNIAQKLYRQPTQVAIRWGIQKGYVLLPKSTREQRIIENADVFSFSIPDDEVAVLNELDRGAQGAISWNPVNSD